MFTNYLQEFGDILNELHVLEYFDLVKVLTAATVSINKCGHLSTTVTTNAYMSMTYGNDEK